MNTDTHCHITQQVPARISICPKELLLQAGDHFSSVQLPVQASRDGTLFVFGDEHLFTEPNKPAFFGYLPDDEILHSKEESSSVVRLSDYLEAMSTIREKGLSLRLDLVVRTMGDFGHLKRVLEDAVACGILSWDEIALKSNNQPLLQRAKRHLPEVKRLLSVNGVPWDLGDCLLYTKASEIHIPATFVNPNLVRDALFRGVNVSVSDLVSESHWARLHELGVSGRVNERNLDFWNTPGPELKRVI